MTNKFEITIPQLSVNDTSLTVSKIYVEAGNLLKIGDPILSVESSKTTEDIFAEQNGFIYLRCEEGCDYDVNTVIGFISDEVIIESATTQQVSNSNNLNEEIITPNIVPIVSLSAESLMLQNNLSIQDFYGLLFVDTNAVNVKLGRSIVKIETIEKKAKPIVVKSIIPANVEVIPVGKQKKLEIEYLSQVQQTGLTSTIHVK